MVVPYVFAGVAASVFGFILLASWRGKKEPAKPAAALAAENGERSPPVVAAASGEPDVIVVGAGVAGAALAYTLGKDGRRVHVIERDLTRPDRIVGELLQPGGYLKLVELGLEDCVEQIDSQRVLGYAVFKDGKSCKVSYPLENFDSNVTARSFLHGRFIQRMREKAATLPNVQLEQGSVTSLIEESGTVKGVMYKTKSGEELKAYAPLTIVCDGSFSNLRRSLCSPKVDVDGYFVGFLLEDCQLPYPNHGHVILGDPSIVLLYPISGTEVRCLVDVPGQRMPSIANGEMQNYLKTKVVPQIPCELQNAFISAIDKGSIRAMPNRTMPASPHLTPGALLLGDAFNMRHPLTGGGMTVALSDIAVLKNLLKPLRDLHDASALCKCLGSFYTFRTPVATTINTMAGSIYQIFSPSPDEARKEMRQAAFDFLSFGGEFAKGSIGLLAGLDSRPLSVIAHFLAIAIYGVVRMLLPYPSPKRVWIGARMLSSASKILLPILKAEGIREVFFPATIPAYIYRTPRTH